jgi:hypothetical protein
MLDITLESLRRINFFRFEERYVVKRGNAALGEILVPDKQNLYKAELDGCAYTVRRVTLEPAGRLKALWRLLTPKMEGKFIMEDERGAEIAIGMQRKLFEFSATAGSQQFYTRKSGRRILGRPVLVIMDASDHSIGEIGRNHGTKPNWQSSLTDDIDQRIELFLISLFLISENVSGWPVVPDTRWFRQWLR